MANSMLPTKDRVFLEKKGFLFNEANDGARKGIIIENYPLHPVDKFNIQSTSLLIILPSGYPDVSPDMFYTVPEVKLKESNALPAQADVKVSVFGKEWQRWSRHAPADAWRPGIDGLQNYLQRVVTALNAA